ncbi:hypothetical protein [Microvirga zambiensis]|uniref:hypothetical protein n=1 Tax=Microvirga zambiensis TaxID=1402137 RepID=UPI00191D3843|nr:hypothetical protein [Microvirga zambiensis]
MVFLDGLASGTLEPNGDRSLCEVREVSYRTESFSDRITILLLQRWTRHGRERVMTTASDGFTARLPNPVVDMLLLRNSVGHVCLSFNKAASQA